MEKVRSEGRRMRNLVILGAGGHGHVVAETAKAMRHMLIKRFVIILMN